MLLLKAVATALVLIAGAAVVLWYANTLNSWVLGGLIGGLAALLLSIPISLTLFTYLSHRHDGHSRMEEEKYQEAMLLSYDYEEMSERALRKISIEEENAYLRYQRGVWGEEYEEEEHYLPDASRRQLPAPRVSNADQQPVYRSPSTQQGARETRQLPARDTEMGSQHTTSRRANNPDFPGYQPEMTRGQFQSQALRIAREEAYRRSEKAEAREDFRTHRSRRPSSPLRTKKLDNTTWKEKPVTSYGDRQDPEDLLDDQEAYPSTPPRYLRRGRRIVDASLSPNSPYRQSPDSTEDQAQQTDSSRDLEAEEFDQAYSTGNLKKPLVRRAPYMYDTDALKSELSQQVDPPITRRSSRNLFVRHDDE